MQFKSMVEIYEKAWSMLTSKEKSSSEATEKFIGIVNDYLGSDQKLVDLSEVALKHTVLADGTTIFLAHVNSLPAELDNGLCLTLSDIAFDVKVLFTTLKVNCAGSSAPELVRVLRTLSNVIFESIVEDVGDESDIMSFAEFVLIKLSSTDRIIPIRSMLLTDIVRVLEPIVATLYDWGWTEPTATLEEKVEKNAEMLRFIKSDALYSSMEHTVAEYNTVRLCGAYARYRRYTENKV